MKDYTLAKIIIVMIPYISQSKSEHYFIARY